MSLRYRKRIKLFDGLYVNLSKNGVSSVSIGKPGATLNIGKNSSVTVGLPGTGISYRTYLPKEAAPTGPDYNDPTQLDELLQHKEQQAAREELDRYLSLKDQTQMLSHEDYWQEIEEKIQAIHADKKAFSLKLDNPKNIALIASAINNNVDGVIFLQNTSIATPLPMPSVVCCPTSEFGEIFIGENMGKVPDAEFMIGLTVGALDLEEQDKKWAKAYLSKVGFTFFMMIFGAYFLTFKIPGFWPTMVGLGLMALIYTFFDVFRKTIYGKEPIETLAMVHRISRNSKTWEKQLQEEKADYKKTIEKHKEAARSGNLELIVESIPLVLSDLPKRDDVMIDAGFSGDDILCIVLKLPQKELLEVKNKLTPGGRESVQEKSAKELNQEYAVSALNLAFYTLAKCYSAYPTISRIKIAGYTNRISEATGTLTNEILLFFNSTRDEIEKINFSGANPIKVSQHLKYQIDIDNNYYLNPLTVSDETVRELRNLESKEENVA